MRDREEVWVALDRGFKAFMDCLGQLTEEELTATEVVGKWSVKDVVSHVWSWADETAETAVAWGHKRPWQEGMAYDDAWNERQVEGRSDLPLITVVDGLTSVHRRLMRLLELADDEALARKGKAPWGDEMTLADFFYTMAEHYQDHATDLRTYQERCLEGCD